MEGKTVAIIGGVTATAVAVGAGLLYFLGKQVPGSSWGVASGVTTGTGTGTTGVPSSVPTSATYKVQILDNSTKKPIPGVVCSTDGYNASTNNNGIVSFVLPLGNYKFNADHNSYVYKGDLWFNVTEVDLGQTFGPQIVEMEPNVPELKVPEGMTAVSMGNNPPTTYPGCGCCQVTSKAAILLQLIDKKGNGVPNVPVHIERVSGHHEMPGDSGKTSGDFTTNSTGLIRAEVGPSGRCKCGYGLSWSNDWRCEHETSAWKATVGAPYAGLYTITTVTYKGAPSFGDEFWDALA